MARRPLQLCSYPGCNATQPEPRCGLHRQRMFTDNRESAHSRGYDRKWRKLRLSYLTQNPICEIKHHCHGAPATEVDHIRPLSAGGERLDEDNLQSACGPCHKWKTATKDRT